MYCKMCKENLPILTELQLIRHMKKVHGIFQCDYIGYDFFSETECETKIHEKKHCNICEFIAESEEERDHHKKINHK